uniref:Uncharacterized protein n=1 Tax=Anopheles christyi TaxID=43041 RepID=A0A182JYK7_9DIPT
MGTTRPSSSQRSVSVREAATRSVPALLPHIRLRSSNSDHHNNNNNISAPSVMAVAAAAAAAAAAISSSTAPPLRPEPMVTDAGGGFNALHGYGGMMVHEHM